METPNLFESDTRSDLERDVIASESQPKYRYEVKQLYADKSKTARVFTFVFDGEEYVTLYRAFHALKKPGETNTDTFKRLVEQAYKA